MSPWEPPPAAVRTASLLIPCSLRGPATPTPVARRYSGQRRTRPDCSIRGRARECARSGCGGLDQLRKFKGTPDAGQLCRVPPKMAATAALRSAPRLAQSAIPGNKRARKRLLTSRGMRGSRPVAPAHALSATHIDMLSSFQPGTEHSPAHVHAVSLTQPCLAGSVAQAAATFVTLRRTSLSRQSGCR